MVYYSVSKEVRARVHFLIAVVSIGTLYAISWALTFAPTRVLALGGLSVHAALPSVFAVYAGYLWLFDKYVWKLPLISRLHGVPNLNGEWTGSVKRDEGVPEPVIRPVRAKIVQNWSDIEVEMEGSSTRSQVKAAAVFINDRARSEIIYCYSSVPLYSNRSENKYGEGFQQLTFYVQDTPRLAGRYFSSKLRGGYTALERAKY
jgi:hypothetical protein